MSRLVELTSLHQQARRDYVASDELSPRSMLASLCWRCRRWGPMFAQLLNGREVCTGCGAEDPLGHRDRLLEHLERIENETIADLRSKHLEVNC